MSRSAPTYAEFVAKYPAFASLTEAAVQDQIDESAALLFLGAWGDWYSTAVELDTAHNLALSSMLMTDATTAVIGSGIVSSASAAGVTTSFATPELGEKRTSRDWYTKSIFGQKFLRLRNVVMPGMDISA